MRPLPRNKPKKTRQQRQGGRASQSVLPSRDTPWALKLGDNTLNEGVKVKMHVQTLQSLDVPTIRGGACGSHTPPAPTMWANATWTSCGICRGPAVRRICQRISAICPRPVGPKGCPTEISQPLLFTGIRPVNTVLPSTSSLTPSPSGTRPRASSYTNSSVAHALVLAEEGGVLVEQR